MACEYGLISDQWPAFFHSIFFVYALVNELQESIQYDTVMKTLGDDYFIKSWLKSV